MKKTLCIITLLIGLLLSQSCSNNTDNTSNKSNSDNTTVNSSVSETEQETELVPSIPEKDMNGKVFKIATPGWGGFTPLNFIDIVSDELNGEVLNDATYNRQIDIQTKYNCILEQVNTDDTNAYMATLKKSVMANDGEFDIVFMRGINYAEAITNGLLLDLAEIEHVNFDNPWWDKASYDVLSIAGKHYAAASDFTTNDELSIWAAFFNKNMIENYQLENPYELVKNGIWTYDKMFEMSDAVDSDLNGDGKRDKDDQFGMTHTLDAVMGMWNSMGVYCAEKDENDIPVFTIESETNVTKIMKLYDGLFNLDTVLNVHRVGIAEDLIFGEGRALFCLTGVYMADTYRHMEDEFGIIPYPKYDESQTSYIPSNNTFCMSLVCVPKTNSNSEDTGIILEDMSYLGYKNVRPAFYDVILQGKVTQDKESGEMLDYIFGNVGYDLGNIFNFNNYAFDLAYLTIELKNDIASAIASKQPAAQKVLDNVIETINSVNEEN